MTDGRRVQRTVKPTKVPGIPKPPSDVPASLQRYLSNLGEALEIRLGRKGDVRDRAITLRELIDSGMAVDLTNNPYDPNNPGGDFGGNNDPEGNLAEFPTAPTGFSVTAGFANVGVFWDHPENQYRGHSYTEVYRADTDALSTAQLIGSTPGNSLTDFIGGVSQQTTYYYWARHVNVNNVQGPFNANAGTEATLEPSPDYLLDLLTDSIDSTHLVQSLRDPISNLPADTNQSFLDVGQDITDLEAQYTVKIQTNFAGNTHISGYGLANTVNNNGNITSAFIIAADRFAIINPTTYSGGQTDSPDPTHVPFVVQSTATTLTLPSNEVVDIPAGVFIDSAFISKARILQLIAGSVTADYVLSSTFIRAPAIHGGTFNIGTFSDNNGSQDISTWSISGSQRISNFSVNANGVMHCKGAVMEGVTIKAPDGTVLVDAGGMTGGSGGNLAYNNQFRRGAVTFTEVDPNNPETGALGQDLYIPDGWVEYQGNGPQAWEDSNNGTTSLFRRDIGYVRCGYKEQILDQYNQPTGNYNYYTSYVRQNTQRFPVVPGETLYVYAQTNSLNGLWMSVAYYSSSNGGSTSNYVTQTNSVFANFDSEQVTGANGAQRQLSVISITVPPQNQNGVVPQYGELRFGNNYSATDIAPFSGDELYYYDVGVSRTPPVIGPKYARTYIRDLSVDTFQIAGNAITVPLGNSDDPNSAFTANEMFTSRASTFFNAAYNAANSWKDGVDVGPLTWDNNDLNTRPEAVTIICNAVIQGTGSSTNFSLRMMQILVANNSVFTSNVQRFGGTDAFTAQENRQIDDTSLVLNVTQLLSDLGMSSPLYFKVQVSNTDDDSTPHGNLRNNGISVLASKK